MSGKVFKGSDGLKEVASGEKGKVKVMKEDNWRNEREWNLDGVIGFIWDTGHFFLP